MNLRELKMGNDGDLEPVDCGMWHQSVHGDKIVRFVSNMDWKAIKSKSYRLEMPDEIKGTTDPQGDIQEDARAPKTLKPGEKCNIKLTLDGTRFEKVSGLETLDPLILRNKPDGDGPLVKGDSRRALVERLQSMLKAIFEPNLGGSSQTQKPEERVTGEFGAWTEAAVLYFQREHKDYNKMQLAEDKKVGPLTSDAFNRILVGRGYDKYNTPEELTGDLKLVTVTDNVARAKDGFDVTVEGSDEIEHVVVQVNRGSIVRESTKVHEKKYKLFKRLCVAYERSNPMKRPCEQSFLKFEDGAQSVVKFLKGQIGEKYDNDKVFSGFRVMVLSQIWQQDPKRAHPPKCTCDECMHPETKYRIEKVGDLSGEKLWDDQPWINAPGQDRNCGGESINKQELFDFYVTAYIKPIAH